MHTNFTGPSDNEGSVLCGIANSILEPYFGVSPVRFFELLGKASIRGDLAFVTDKNMDPFFNLVHPFFPWWYYVLLSKGELRTIRRTDSDKSRQLVSEGGKKAKAALVQLRTWEVTLYHSPDAFFHGGPHLSAIGTKMPVLMLINRKWMEKAQPIQKTTSRVLARDAAYL